VTREAIATALDKAAEALAEAAHAMRATEPDAARASVPEAGEPVPPRSAPAPAAPLPKRKPQEESAFTECPAHRQPFKEGRYGGYCSGTGEPDGNWFNDKGYCRVTPKSAGAWLKQHPKGAPAPAPQDVDDIPF
jgi:hypothetical protein